MDIDFEAMASDRIDKFCADAEAALSKPAASALVLGKECARLAVWLQKHQDEPVPSAQQGKLMSLLDLHVKNGREVYNEAVQSLVSTMLSLPEGKLITAKSKQKCLKILDSLAVGGGKQSALQEMKAKRFAVFDFDETLCQATVVEEDDESNVIEHVSVPSELVGTLVAALERETTTYCTLNDPLSVSPEITKLL